MQRPKPSDALTVYLSIPPNPQHHVGVASVRVASARESRVFGGTRIPLLLVVVWICATQLLKS
jgi:hypothetical protein